jgi:hypothetical protein
MALLPAMNGVEEVITKLKTLSPQRTRHVLALIQDLADLQAIEDRRDLDDARASLAEPGEDIPLEQIAKELGV